MVYRVLRTLWRDPLCYKEQKSLQPALTVGTSTTSGVEVGCRSVFQGPPIFVLGFCLPDQCPSWLQNGCSNTRHHILI